MKIKRLTPLLLAGVLIFCKPVVQAGPDTLSMGSAYVNDVFYSMENGTVSTIVREVWDLAFSTKVFSASILINDGSGSALYTWGNGDTSGWNSVDTVGMSTWKVLYNDPADWENGAFVRHAKGHPDYGWGVYNAITHDVVGDSLYILKRADGAIFKIWVKVKTFLGAAPVWVFKYALLDGSMEQEVTLEATNYVDRNFIYFSLSAGLPINREPEANSWDLLFTKYMAIHPTGSPYIVTGVLSNYNRGVNKYTQVPRTYANWAQKPFEYERSVIGYDWKTFDMGQFVYIVDDSTVFFIQDLAGDVYKLYFTAFAGTSSGIIMLDKDRMSVAGLPVMEPESSSTFLYPNPATGLTSLRMDLPAGQTAEIGLYDMQGKKLRNYTLTGKGSLSEQEISLETVPPGLYVVTVFAGGSLTTMKLVVNRL